MTYKQARQRAAIAGAVLFTMPVLDVILGAGTGGVVHLVVGSLGAALVALSGKW